MPSIITDANACARAGVHSASNDVSKTPFCVTQELLLSKHDHFKRWPPYMQLCTSA